MKKFLLNFKRDSGSVIVMFAISISVLLGMTALVIDGGRLYHEKSVLQNAVDAAALGGAQGLLVGEMAASSIAKDIASQNAFSVDDADLMITSDSITVSNESNVPMTFAKVLGINQASVSATATAKIGLLKSANRVIPIAVEKKSVPDSTELKCENTGQNHGNCGYLDMNGNGADGLADGILNGIKVTEGMEFAETEPGQKWGPVKGAFETLINNDAGKSQCQSPSTADNSCDRVVNIVIIDTWEGVAGKDSVKVIGLAAYWLEGIGPQKGIIGHFIKKVTVGELGGTGIGNLYGVKLTD